MEEAFKTYLAGKAISEEKYNGLVIAAQLKLIELYQKSTKPQQVLPQLAGGPTDATAGLFLPALVSSSPFFLPVIGVSSAVVFATFFYAYFVNKTSNWKVRAWINLAIIAVVLSCLTLTLDVSTLNLVHFGICSIWAVLLWYSRPPIPVPDDIHEDSDRFGVFPLVELAGLGFLRFAGSPLTFPLYLSIKTAVSVILFTLELGYRHHEKEKFQILRYLSFFYNAPCRSMPQVGGDVLHAAGGDKPTRHKDQSVSKEAYYVTCIGVCVQQDLQRVLQRLEGCGKCHDWSAVAASTLRLHRFLSFSLLSHARWVFWIITGVALLMYRFVRHAGVVSSLVDSAIVCMIGFELYNLKAFAQPKAQGRQGSGAFSFVRNCLIVVLSIAYHLMAPQFPADYGIFAYIATSAVAALLVDHFLIWFIPKLDNVRGGISGKGE